MHDNIQDTIGQIQGKTARILQDQGTEKKNERKTMQKTGTGEERRGEERREYMKFSFTNDILLQLTAIFFKVQLIHVQL